MVCRTVGQLIDLLSLYPRDMEFIRFTEGFYQCHQKASALLYLHDVPLTEPDSVRQVEEGNDGKDYGRVREVPGSKKERMSIDIY